MAVVMDKSVRQLQAAGARLMHSTPGMLDKLAVGTNWQPKEAGGAHDQKDAQIADLQEKLRGLEEQYKNRIATFVKRETQSRSKIETLEQRLNEGSDHDDHMHRMGVIQDMHSDVVKGLERIQTNTARTLQDQEKDLMQAFRSKLQEVTRDLEQQRNKTGEPSAELQARHKKVLAELHGAREQAQKLDRKNQLLDAENKKLQEKLRTQHDDRQALLRELAQAKKEHARLKCKENFDTAGGSPDAQNSIGEQDKETTLPRRRNFSQKQIDQVRLQQTCNRAYEREMRYREAVQRLRRTVEAERASVRALRQQQAEMLQQRTELEVMLRQCLEDVKAEMLRGRQEKMRKDCNGPPMTLPSINSVSVHELNAQDRERVLELLLSQQRVVQLLYSNSLPQNPMQATDGAASPELFEGREDDLSWLGDLAPPDF